MLGADPVAEILSPGGCRLICVRSSNVGLISGDVVMKFKLVVSSSAYCFGDNTGVFCSSLTGCLRDYISLSPFYILFLYYISS